MYQINNQDYEVGKIEFQQNIELMKYLKEKVSELKVSVDSDDKEVKINFTHLFQDICENNLLGKVISFMIKPVGLKWSPEQTNNPEVLSGIEALYEDEISEIWDTFWSKKKTLIGGMLNYSSLAAGMLK